MIAAQYEDLSVNVPVFFEAEIELLSPPESDGGGGIAIHTNTAIYGCQIGVNKSSDRWIHWWREDAPDKDREDLSPRTPLRNKDKSSYTCRAEFFPNQGRIDFYIDGEKVASEPGVVIERLDMVALYASTRSGSSGTLISRFYDVQIGRINQ